MPRKINWFSNLPVSLKFQKDVIWNFLSLMLLGISGIVLNILIARYYGASTLGFFNKVYAIYALGSQFAVGSVHLSVQKYTAQHEKMAERNKILTTGLVATLFFAVMTILIFFLSRGLWAWFLREPEISISIIYILPGLFGFAVNKTILAFFNGLRKMKIFAFFQGLRYILIVSFATLAVILKISQNLLPIIFSAAEITLFIFLFLYALRFFDFIKPQKWGDWLKKHFIFGYQSLLGNVLTDVNTRVDILILAFFLSDKQVGIYSFAATLAEGFGQLMVVLKNNINPVIARLIAEKKPKALEKIVQKGVKLTYQFIFVIGLVSIVLYPVLIKIFLPGSDFMISFPVFAILITGIIISSGYQPFQMLLAQAGFPKLYTRLIIIVFITNAVLNFVLIPILGIYGSAIATAISFIILALVLKILVKVSVKIKI